MAAPRLQTVDRQGLAMAAVAVAVVAVLAEEVVAAAVAASMYTFDPLDRLAVAPCSWGDWEQR